MASPSIKRQGQDLAHQRMLTTSSWKLPLHLQILAAVCHIDLDDNLRPPSSTTTSQPPIKLSSLKYFPSPRAIELRIIE